VVAPSLNLKSTVKLPRVGKRRGFNERYEMVTIDSHVTRPGHGLTANCYTSSRH
jgi:hypothetical protein